MQPLSNNCIRVVLRVQLRTFVKLKKRDTPLLISSTVPALQYSSPFLKMKLMMYVYFESPSTLINVIKTNYYNYTTCDHLPEVLKYNTI